MSKLTLEISKRDEGIQAAACKNYEMLMAFREIADRLSRERPITICDVREEADRMLFFYVPGNWLGAIFKEKKWAAFGYVKSRYPCSHARLVTRWINMENK